VITHVAILDAEGKVWQLPKPNRHHNVIHSMYEALGKPEAKRLLSKHAQGFVNDQGKFLDRRAANAEAVRCDQILPPYNPANPAERRWDLKPDHTPRELFSEDLW
jgi:hypothetical protein